MNLLELTKHLLSVGDQPIKIENVPEHFHVTEFGYVTKTFVDCGGEIRRKDNYSMQIWVADDLNHRITGVKLLNIVELENFQTAYYVMVEYDTNGTIGLYGLKLEDDILKLVPTKTDCLAKDKCGITDNCSSKGCC